jgi:hypothetical protein
MLLNPSTPFFKAFFSREHPISFVGIDSKDGALHGPGQWADLYGILEQPIGTLNGHPKLQLTRRARFNINGMSFSL